MRKECQDLNDHITALADGEISPEEEKSIGLHLAHCQDCRSKVEDMIKIQAWMKKSWPDIKPSKDFDHRFIAALDHEKASRKQRASWLSGSQRWVAACVLIFFLITGGIWVTQKEKKLTLDQVIISTEFELFRNMIVIKNLEAFENYDLLLAMNEIAGGAGE